MPIRSLMRNMRKMSIIFMNCSHSLAARDAWIYCFLTSSLSIILISSCGMHASSTVTFPVKTSSCRFPNASRYVSVVPTVSGGIVGSRGPGARKSVRPSEMVRPNVYQLGGAGSPPPAGSGPGQSPEGKRILATTY